jgi:hypothetical protein
MHPRSADALSETPSPRGRLSWGHCSVTSPHSGVAETFSQGGRAPLQRSFPSPHRGLAGPSDGGLLPWCVAGFPSSWGGGRTGKYQGPLGKVLFVVGTNTAAQGSLPPCQRARPAERGASFSGWGKVVRDAGRLRSAEAGRPFWRRSQEGERDRLVGGTSIHHPNSVTCILFYPIY